MQLLKAKHRFAYSIIGLIAGISSIGFGIWLLILGLSGKMNWSVTVLGFKSEIAEATPGAMLFIVGLVIILLTKYK